MNKKKSLITALLLVVVAGLSITAGTFAYFQWTTGAEGGTAVNVTIEMGGITMHIEPEQTEFVGLYPTAHCENNVRYGDALVTIVNNTGTLAIPSFKLKVKVTDKDGNGVPADALSHINYTVVPIETTIDGSGNPVKGKVNSCAYPLYMEEAFLRDAYGYQLLFDNVSDWNTSLKFESVSTDGSWTHVPNIGDKTHFMDIGLSGNYLPRQYFLSGAEEDNTFSVGDIEGITFRGEAYSTTYQYYRVYVWVDDEYTSTIVGNTVADPLQNAKIEITWSEESMVQQVSGESNNTEPVPAAGLYDNDGNLTYTWDELIENEDITVVDNKITTSDFSLTGDLVIPEGIIEIGEHAFGSNDGLGTQLTSVYIPASVTKIGEWAFSYCSLSEISFAQNSQLTFISDYAFQGSKLVRIELPSKVEEIGHRALADNQLSYVVLPSSLTYIGENAFDGNNLNSLVFNGTMEEWNSVEINPYWGVGGTPIIICSDGEIQL